MRQAESELLGKLARQSRSDRKTRPDPRSFARPRPVFSNFRAKFIQAPEGGIPARVGNLLGHAECAVWDRGGSGYTIEATGEADIDVLNWGVNVACATGDRYGFAIWYDKAWWLIAEDCADDPEAARMSITGGETTEDEEGTSGEIGAASLFTVSQSVLDDEFVAYQASVGGLPPEP